MSAYDVPTPLIPDYIAQHGRWSARKPALLCGPRALDWSGFDAATCQVANGLAALGLVPGARVAVLMGNGIEMALALFGAIRAGGVIRRRLRHTPPPPAPEHQIG